MLLTSNHRRHHVSRRNKDLLRRNKDSMTAWRFFGQGHDDIIPPRPLSPRRTRPHRTAPRSLRALSGDSTLSPTWSTKKVDDNRPGGTWSTMKQIKNRSLLPSNAVTSFDLNTWHLRPQ